jgi:hypothetical protein
MKKYTTLAPYVIFIVNNGGQKKEYSLKKGDTVELPEDDIAVRALLARRQIEETTAPVAEKTKVKNKTKK